MSNSLDSNEAQKIGPDLRPNCIQKLSAYVNPFGNVDKVMVISVSRSQFYQMFVLFR